MALVTLAVLVLLIVGPLRWFLSSLDIDILPSSRSNELIAWVPEDADWVEGVNLKELRSNPDYPRELSSSFTPAVRIFDVDAIEEAVLVYSSFQQAIWGHSDLVIVRFTNPPSFDKAIRKGELKEQKKEDRRYYVGEGILGGNNWLFRASDTIVLFADSEARLQRAMAGDGTTWRISKELRSAIKSTNGPALGAAVGPPAQMGISPLARALGPLGRHNEAQPLCLSETYETRVTDSGVEWTINKTYSSADKAKLARDRLQGTADSAPVNAHDPGGYMFSVIRDSLMITATGEHVVMRYNVPHKDVKRVLSIYRGN
jgi:hypothetical protein